MIPDGYNESVTVDGCTFVFRPLVHIQRESLELLQRSLGEHAVRVYCEHIVSNQLALPGWDLDDCIHDMTEESFCLLLKAVMGSYEKQKKEQENLKATIRLMKSHSHLLNVTCEQCKVWWYDPFDGTTAKRAGEPLKRPVGSVLPCDTKIGCPKGHWASPTVPMDKNVLAFKHFRLCEQSGQWPDDMIVMQNAAVIRTAMRECVS